MSRVLLMLLLVVASNAMASAQDRGLKLAGFGPDLVRWKPSAQHLNYRELAPSSTRLDMFKTLAYRSVALDETHDLRIRRDKTLEETISKVHLYLSSTGAENDGNLGFWLDATQQRVEIEAAYVLQSDASVIDIEPGTIQINTDNSANIFNDSVYVTLPLPQLKPGSIAVLRYKIITPHSKLDFPWSRSFYPVNLYPLEHFRVDAHWDDISQKPVWRTDYPKLVCLEQSYELSCTSNEETAAIILDRDMPSIYDVLPVLILAAPTDWSVLSSKMRSLTDSALSDDKRIADLASRLRDGTVDSHETLTRLAQFVSREIRYVGIEHGHGGMIPRSTISTLERRFGDCKDKTMLFVDLARHSGLDAYPVLTSTQRSSLDKLLIPTTNYFNHMLACVKLEQHEEVCVDLTDPDTSSGHLSYAVQGAVALAVGRGAESPRKLVAEPITWIVRVNADNKMMADGSIIETLERRYDSHWAAGLRRTLAAKSQTELNRWLLDDYRLIMGDKFTPDVWVHGLGEPQSALVISSTTEFKNVFVASQIRNYQDLEPWLRNLANKFKTLNTHYPYAFNGVSYQSEIRFQLHPEKHVENTGAKIDYISPWGAFHRHYRQDGDSVTAYTNLKMPRVQVPIDKIAEFNRFLDLVGQETRIWFGLQ
jgi:transglutaminase-like putative cysteine protease